MYGVSSSCGSTANGYAHSSLDFLNSIGIGEELKQPTLCQEQTLEDAPGTDEPSISLTITNVVCMANMRCHLRLKDLARSSVNVEYKALQNHVIMRLRKPYTVATIWSSGKIWCTGANSIKRARDGARRIARRIARVGFPCRFSKFRIVNIMATCRLPFRVRLEDLVRERPRLMSYEPELAPGLNYKANSDSSTSLKLFSTGRVVIMGSSMDSIGNLVQEIVPLASIHQTSEPLSDSSEDEAQDANSGGARDPDQSAAHRRHLNRRKRARIMRKNPFAEVAADKIPELADVLLDEGEMEEDETVFNDAEEEANDAVCTDNDSEEESETPDKLQKYPNIIGHQAQQWPCQDVTTTSTITTMSPAAEGSVVIPRGPAKRACITTYSDHQSIPTTATCPLLPTTQPQYIYTTTGLPVQITAQQQQQQQHQFTPTAPFLNTQAKIVTLNPSGQAGMVRLVNPLQLAQHQLQQPQQQQRFVLNRLPNGTTILNPSGFVMAPVGAVAPTAATFQFAPATQTQLIGQIPGTLTQIQPGSAVGGGIVANTTFVVTTPTAYR